MKLFINAGHHDGWGNEEAKIVKLIRDEVKKLLPDAIYVPDNLNLSQSIDWINKRADRSDFALGIHLNWLSDSSVRGVEGYYDDNANDASIMASCVANSMNIPNRGAKHDSNSSVGSLGFLRLLRCDSVVIECGYQSNKEDREAINNHKAIAKGLVEGLKKIGKIQEIKKEIIKTQNIVIVLLKKLIAKLKEKYAIFTGKRSS